MPEYENLTAQETEQTMSGYGTGSSPPPQKGWHLSRRFAPRRNPFRIPFFCIAWYIYTEQVGSNLHALGSHKEIYLLYSLRIQRTRFFMWRPLSADFPRRSNKLCAQLVISSLDTASLCVYYKIKVVWNFIVIFTKYLSE